MKRISLLLTLLLGTALLAGTVVSQDLGRSTEDPATVLRTIQTAIDESGANWTAGENDIFLLSPEEKRRLCGALDTLSLDPIPESEQVMRYAWHPEKFDWRNKDTGNWMTPVKNQGGCGSCVAFATIGTLEGQLNIYNNDPNLDLDLSEAHIYFCGGRGCDDGWWVGESYKFVENSGAADEDCLPYTAGNGRNQKCSDACPDLRDRTYTISCWGTIEGGSASTPAEMKEYLLRGPVTTTMTVFEDFDSYTGGVYEHVWGEVRGGHAIVFVGWDDTTDPPCWIVRNSWGNWGEGGYFRIRMGTNNSGIEEQMFYMMLGDVANGDISDNGYLYGYVEVGDTRDWEMTITNNGNADLEIYGFSDDLTPSFYVTPPSSFPQTILPGESLPFAATFAPDTVGFLYERIKVYSNSCRQFPDLKLRGTGILHTVKAVPTTLKESMDEGRQHTIPFSVVNEGIENRIFSVEILREWLSVAPDTGFIQSGGSVDFVATVDASSMEPGPYVTNILIRTDDETDKVVVLPINLDILEASGVAVTLPTTAMPMDQCLDVGLCLDNNSRINTSVSEVAMSISFDPEFLEVKEIAPWPRVEHMTDFLWTELEAGTVTLSISDTAGGVIAPGVEDIASLSLQFHNGTSCGDSLELVINEVTLTDTTGTLLETRPRDGLVISLCKGDVDANGEVNVNDVLKAVQFILNTSCGDGWTHDCWAADYNDDGTIDAADLVGMITVILGD